MLISVFERHLERRLESMAALESMSGGRVEGR
jgi:hypothetical protein